MFNINNYVYVTNPNKNLYRRRCRITQIIEDSGTTLYLVYSEGLDEDELMTVEDMEPSKY